MTSTDVTVSILREIRDEIRSTNQRLDQTRLELGQRLDQTNQRLDQTNQRLDHVEGTLLDLAEQQRFIVRYTKALAERDSRIEGEVADLRARVEKIESRLEPAKT